MKLITRDSDYAIRALVYIARARESIVSVSELVDAVKIPRAFLRKILQMLHKGGMLAAYKGKGGGFDLKRSPAQIRLADIMKIFQGELAINQCSFVKDVCPNIKKCSLKKKIDRIEAMVIKKLNNITLNSIMKGE